jgi:hypothetical protein
MRSLRSLAVACSLAVATTRALDAQSHARDAAPLDPAVVASLDSARVAVWRAWFAGDTVALAQLIPATLAAGSPLGWTSRAQSFAESVESAASGRKLVDIRFDSTTIDLHDDVAVMRARYRCTFELPNHQRDTIAGSATEVFVRERGRWVNPFWYLRSSPR